MTLSEPATPSFEPKWLKLDQGESITPFAGITMWPMTGDRLMFNFVRLDPLAEVPHHQHSNEQTGAVLEGVLVLTVDGDTRSLAVGDAYLIPPNMPHSGRAGETGCVVIDVFSPPRDDYRLPGTP